MVDPALEALWRSTVVRRVEAAEGALGVDRPADASAELEAAAESVLAAARAADDDVGLRARLETEAEQLGHLVRRAAAEERGVGLREELAAARRRLERVFDAR